jgi:tryptophan 2,3-dioxygenase
MSGCPYLSSPERSMSQRSTPSERMQRHMRARAEANRDQSPPPGTYYTDYLQLSTLLSCQDPVSRTETGTYAHEELLFIIVHQSHELWFKLIISDLSRVHEILSRGPEVSESELAKAIASLERIKAIQPMLIQKLTVLETMTPMEFLEFRDLLVPASGFQSYQFRIIEILLGLSTRGRQNMSHEYMRKKFSPEDYEKVVFWENQPSLEQLTEKWLEQMPWLNRGVPDGVMDFNWTDQYKVAVDQVLAGDEINIRENYSRLGIDDDEFLQEELDIVRQNRLTFESLFNAEQHNELVDRGVRKLSQKAILNAIFAFLYRDLGALHSPFRFLTLLVEIDDGFTSWRYRHAQMAHRMIGRKMGTGATSGADHLMRVAQQNSSFKDLRNLSTFLVPLSKLPPLPRSVLSLLRLHTPTC